ncbi:MAG: M56 family metallopeptidase [Pirellula sp.]|nr:M56 family metallopeptidase [Pirellula sp.]
MSFTLHAFIWACLQISVLGACSLVIAWLFRGGRPQWVSAFLTGSCVAMLVVAGVAFIPNGQWTIVSQSQFEDMQIHEFAVPVNAPDDRLETARDPISNTGSMETRRATLSKNNDSLLYSVHMLVSRALLRFDQQVRESDDLRDRIQSRTISGIAIALISGLLLMLLLWFSSWLYLRRIFRCSTPIEDQEILSLVDFYSRKFALSSKPALRESPSIHAGATVGWVHTTVFLHSGWREWSDEEKAAVIAHELAHVSRYDYVWVVIATWARVLLFFHPMVHLLVQRLRTEQELAADQLAAGKIGNTRAYTHALASLALRDQRDLKASSPKLGSMLAIGQICVTRRVMMLRQGILKPVQTRSRLCFAILLAGACSAIPFTGLRGSIQEGSPNYLALEAIQDPTPDTETPNDEKSDSQASDLSQLEFRFNGSLVYRPGRFRSGEFGPEAAWIQDWFTVGIMGKPIPDKAVLYGKSHIGLRWEDETRQNGSVDLSANVTEAESSLPGQMQAMSNFPASIFSKPNSDRVVSKRDVGGRVILGLSSASASDSPEKWMIDDENGFFVGTLEDAERFAQGQRTVLDAVPPIFRDNYTKAAFAIVFIDCALWASKLESFVSGSPRESEFKPAVTLLRDVQQVGLFVDGCKSPACTIRAITANAREAEQLAQRAGGLLEVAKLAIAESKSANEAEALNELARSAIETMAIAVQGNEVAFSFDIFAPSFDNQSAFAFVNRFYRGWQIMHFSGLANEPTSAEKVAYVMPNDDHPKMPGLFSQTIDAKSYRGKKVTFDIEMQCDEQGYANSGAFVWASRHEEVNQQIYGDRKPIKSGAAYTNHRMLAARTKAMDGVSTFRAAMDAERTRVEATNDGSGRTDGRTSLQARPNTNEDGGWQKVTVSLMVPEDAEHLSFGCYSKNRIVKIRNGNFTVSDADKAGSESDALGYDAVSDVPFNLLIVPGYQIESSPSNLDFSVSPSTSVGVAEQPAKTDSSPTKR